MSQHHPNEQEFNRRLDLALWKKLFQYAARHRTQVTGLALFAVLTAGTEVMFPLLTRYVIDDVAAQGGEVDLLRYGLMYGALVVLLVVSVFMFIRLGGHIKSHVSYDIRREGFENLQRLSFAYYDHRPVGWLMARMTSDCERLANILTWGTLDLFWGFTLMTGIAIAMLIMDYRLGLAVLSAVPILAWASAQFQTRILASSRRIRKTNSRITAAYNESIMGIRTTKSFVSEQHNLDEFRQLSDSMYQASVRNAVQSAIYLPVVLTLASLALGISLAMGGTHIIAGTLSIGTLVAFMSYARHFFEPIEELAHWFAEMQMAQASAERILGLIAESPQIQDSEEVTRRMDRIASKPRSAGIADDGYPNDINEIEFRQLGFAYQDGARVLDDINLKVHKGQTIALVGPTGGGKSTLVNVLCRFYEPTQGGVYINGMEYRQRSLHWLQSNLGMVLQSSHVFSGTIADNIRYGRLDADRAEIERVATLAGASHFINKLEHGFDTSVGEGGVRLSTGQKQLISFARAILAKPQLLVMDEATSSVDTETEQFIQQGMQQVLRDRISFVIAHRLSTIRSADRILVIEAGRICESGTHSELVAARGRYFRLYTQQSLRETGPVSTTMIEQT